MNNITVETIIEENIRCSEIHRAFFEKEIGKKFSFNASFQRWLKENAGKQYLKAIEVWYEFQSQKKKNESKIDSQFEYNTYIRDFFKANQGSKLSEYKKALPGTNKYEEKDLLALSNEE